MLAGTDTLGCLPILDADAENEKRLVNMRAKTSRWNLFVLCPVLPRCRSSSVQVGFGIGSVLGRFVVLFSISFFFPPSETSEIRVTLNPFGGEAHGER